MHRILTVIITFLLLALASPLLHQLSWSFYAPDFGLIAVLFVAIRTPVASGVATVFCIGLLKDAFALGSPIGLYTQIAVILFLLTKVVAQHLNLRSVFPALAITTVASLLSSLLFLALTAVFDRNFDAYDLIPRVMLPQALMTAPFAPMLFLLFDRADGLFARRRLRRL